MSVANELAVRNEYRLHSWTEIIRECEDSGLSNKEYCAQRGLSEKTYYYWLRKVRVAAAAAMEPQLVRLDESSREKTSRRIEIRYGDAELKLSEDVDLEAVAVLLKTLRHHD